ncbi:MAG: hypothetical protein JXR88_11785 [Clostridia bacterium]|nr:hypothetical protein [Clostridia bacterium]
MKKLLLIVSIAMMMFMLASFTMADTIDPEIIAIVQTDVDQTNATIDAMIEKALDRADEILDQYEDNCKLAKKELEGQSLTDRLNSLTANKDVEITNLINNLVNDTNAVAQAMFARANDLGVTVLCELVPVIIDGRTVMIDPIRVIGD